MRSSPCSGPEWSPTPSCPNITTPAVVRSCSARKPRWTRHGVLGLQTTRTGDWFPVGRATRNTMRCVGSSRCSRNHHSRNALERELSTCVYQLENQDVSWRDACVPQQPASFAQNGQRNTTTCNPTKSQKMRFGVTTKKKASVRFRMTTSHVPDTTFIENS